MKIQMDQNTTDVLILLVCMSPLWLPILFAGLFFIIHGK